MSVTHFVDADGTVSAFEQTSIACKRKPTVFQVVRATMGLAIVGVGFWIGGKVLKQVFLDAYAESKPK